LSFLVNDILKILEDGKWHDFLEIINFFSNKHDVNSVIDFLTEFGFVEQDQGQNRMKINASFFDFIQEIQTLE